MKIKDRTFRPEHMEIMGILNVTPDSFSDGGKFTEMDAALKQVERMIKEGASIIDVGGESTRPGFAAVPAEEEMRRVIPVITEIKKNFDILVSVDTYKAVTAKAALLAGADIVNDVWGFKKDPDIAKVTAEHDAYCVLMHNRTNTDYNDFMEDVLNDLRESIAIAKKAGVKDDHIIVDPGVGFAKSLEQNLIVTREVGRLRELGYPVLLATSRKSMIGLTLDEDKDHRLEGTIATSCQGVMAGCEFVRVHDVLENRRAIRMMEAIRDGRKEA
ncbi:MAG: dihydropteroate synthase [Lachnospiraceae bacterium]|jgi:dihydropteroate synthase|nr:dihydropteroate synthase [Lachnospiraceae bacterium]